MNEVQRIKEIQDRHLQRLELSDEDISFLLMLINKQKEEINKLKIM